MKQNVSENFLERQQQTLKKFEEIAKMKTKFIGKEMAISILGAEGTAKIKDIHMSENSRLLIIECDEEIRYELSSIDCEVLVNKDGNFSMKSGGRTLSVSK